MKTCKDCGKFECHKHYARCYHCHKSKNRQWAAARRAEIKQAELADNAKLLPTGYKRCRKCIKKKRLCEFSTSQPHRQGKINAICDACLCRIYSYKDKHPTLFTPSELRRRAYAVNTNARNRIKLLTLNKPQLSELTFICKPQHVQELLNKYAYKCCYCQVQITPGNLQVDHATPLSRGGQHEFENLRPACSDCNRLKWNRTADEFTQFMADYLSRWNKPIEFQDKKLGS